MTNSRRSVKRSRVIKNLATSNSFKEACIKSGYSSKSNNIYSLREVIKGDLKALGYTPEAIKDEFLRLGSKCEELGDMSTAMRGIENIAKVSGLYKESNSINTAIFNFTPDDSKLIRDKLQAVDAVEVTPTEDTVPID